MLEGLLVVGPFNGNCGAEVAYSGFDGRFVDVNISDPILEQTLMPFDQYLSGCSVPKRDPCQTHWEQIDRNLSRNSVIARREIRGI